MKTRLKHFVVCGLLIWGQSAWAATAPAQANVPAAPLPPDPATQPLPATESPVEFFRKLLSMPPAERETALAGKSAKHRETLQAKLAEYESLMPAEREARLQRLQLPAYLLPLMQMNPGARSNRLDRVPERDRLLVKTRLAEWDRLGPEQQREILGNRGALQYFFRPAETPTPVIQNANLLAIYPPGLKAKLEDGLKRWHTLDNAERDALTSQFRQLFELDPAQQEKVLQLRTFSQQERIKMKQTLTLFSRLPDQQREECLKGFRKFANLTPEQRDSFMLNVNRWLSMTPEERNLWRRLVLRLQQTPMPPPPPRAGGSPQTDIVKAAAP